MYDRDWISPATWRNGLVRQKSAHKVWLEAEAEHRVSPSTLAQRHTSRVLACRCGQCGAAQLASTQGGHTRARKMKRGGLAYPQCRSGVLSRARTRKWRVAHMSCVDGCDGPTVANGKRNT